MRFIAASLTVLLFFSLVLFAQVYPATDFVPGDLENAVLGQTGPTSEPAASPPASALEPVRTGEGQLAPPGTGDAGLAVKAPIGCASPPH